MRRLLGALLLLALVATVASLAYQVLREQQYRRLLATGEAALTDGHGFRAVEAFSGALALRPDSMVAYYRRGEAYRAQRQYPEAIRDLREASRLAPDAVPPLVALGEIYDSRGEPDRAAEWYAEAAARVGDADPALLYALALARYRTGAPAAAIDPLQRAVAQDDSLAEAHYLLGVVNRDVRNVEAAIASLDRAVRVAPELSAAREELADLYRAEKRPEDEIRELRALAALDQDPERRMALALAEARHQQFDTALAVLAEAASRSPDNSRLMLATGRVLVARAEHTRDAAVIDQARRTLERALAGTTRRSEGLALYGRALMLDGRLEEADRLLREAVGTSPVEPQAFAYLADAAERLRQPARARDALLSLDALEGDTASPERRTARARRIGALALAAGDAHIAADYLRRAEAGGPADAALLGDLADALWQIGDAAGARATLARALALEPRRPDLLRLARVIR